MWKESTLKEWLAIGNATVRPTPGPAALLKLCQIWACSLCLKRCADDEKRSASNMHLLHMCASGVHRATAEGLQLCAGAL